MNQFNSMMNRPTLNRGDIRTLYAIAVLTGFILMIPLVAMQFTDEVVWHLGDFIVAGVLLSGAGVLYWQISRRLHKFSHKALAALTVLAVLLLVWGSLALAD